MTQSVLVYGGKGALGSKIIEHFKSKLWNVYNVDVQENLLATKSLSLTQDSSLEKQYNQVESFITDNTNEKFDAILNVAGGWCGGNSASKDFIKNCDLSLKQSVWTSCISAHIAAKFLKDNGLLILPGAKASLQPTSGMIAYGMAKACVNHLVQSLGGHNSGLPPHATVLAILPVMLDTPMNRKWMPDADTSSWTPLEIITEKLYDWTVNPNTRPKTGSLVSIVTEQGNTTFNVA